MNKEKLFQNIQSKSSYLCVGLDSDMEKIPSHLHREKDPVFEFNKQIIDATHKYCVAYKPNLAFYEVQGSKGWESLQKTLEYIPDDIFTIADAKRGDIGNTSRQYALAFFNHLDFDAITVAPYMGKDSVEPFLGFEDKWVILLALTSNKGSVDFQLLEDKNSHLKLFEKVLTTSCNWASTDQMMYVVGATRAESLESIRKLIPDHFLLIPGIGAQGGSLELVSKYGMNQQCGLLVNSSRGIIYASDGTEFSKYAEKEAQKLQQQMEGYLQAYLR